jgi:hypothetical protein
MDCVEQFHSAILVVVAKVLFGWPVQRGYIERDFKVIHLDAHDYDTNSATGGMKKTLHLGLHFGRHWLALLPLLELLLRPAAFGPRVSLRPDPTGRNRRGQGSRRQETQQEEKEEIRHLLIFAGHR